MLNIRGLHVEREGKEILKGIDLEVGKGELHVVMGPNGAGKSTLASAASGHPFYEVTKGSIALDGDDITESAPEVRSRKGLFVSFQHPLEIPGVSTEEFLRTSLNEIRTYRGEDPMDAFDFEELLEAKRKTVGLTKDHMERSMNEGFSGGEKKRNEMLQLALLEPKVAILDEIDSGLDVDGVRTICESLQAIRAERPELSVLMITHYQRVLEYLTPDVVHILANGNIIKQGDATLAARIEKEGYDMLIQEHA